METKVIKKKYLEDITRQSDALLGKSTDDLFKKKEPKYSITLNQLVNFIEASESTQRRILNGQINPPKESFFWYQGSKAAIKKSIPINDVEPIYQGINKLKKTKTDGIQKERNRILSITALEKYLQISLPLQFRKQKKEVINNDIKYFDYLGIRIKITPDIIFKSQDYIGAVKLNINKTKPFNKLRMEIVSYFLYQYLKKVIKEEGKTIDPKLCLCIDVFGKNFAHVPTGTSVPSIIIQNGCKELINMWDSLI